MKIGEPFQFKLLFIDRFLIRSRWIGYEVEASEPTSVFILILEDLQAEPTDGFDPAAYVQVAWGICKRERDG
jgi:hypothetical protein